MNLGDLPDNSENEVSPPTPLQKGKKRRCGHQSDCGVDRLKNRAGLQDAFEPEEKRKYQTPQVVQMRQQTTGGKEGRRPGGYR
jgi:hypothetical protein